MIRLQIRPEETLKQVSRRTEIPVEQLRQVPALRDLPADQKIGLALDVDAPVATYASTTGGEAVQALKDKQARPSAIFGPAMAVLREYRKNRELDALLQEDRLDKPLYEGRPFAALLRFHLDIVNLAEEKQLAGVQNRHVLSEPRALEGTERPTGDGFVGPIGDGQVVEYAISRAGSNKAEMSYWFELDRAGIPINGQWIREPIFDSELRRLKEAIDEM